MFFGEDSALTAMRAVGPGYPLRGRLKIADEPFAPARETDELPGRGETWLDSRLLARLGARVGDTVNIGASAFTVTRVLDYRPDQGSAFVDLAPSLLIPLADLPATELLGPGSRATYSLLFAGEAGGHPRSSGELLAERKARGERLVGRRRGEPADPVLDRARGPVPEPLRHDHRAARGGRGRDGGAALHAASPRQRRAHEVHGRAAAPRAAGDGIELALIALIAALVGAALGWLAQELLTRLLRRPGAPSTCRRRRSRPR